MGADTDTTLSQPAPASLSHAEVDPVAAHRLALREGMVVHRAELPDTGPLDPRILAVSKRHTFRYGPGKFTTADAARGGTAGCLAAIAAVTAGFLLSPFDSEPSVPLSYSDHPGIPPDA